MAKEGPCSRNKTACLWSAHMPILGIRVKPPLAAPPSLPGTSRRAFHPIKRPVSNKRCHAVPERTLLELDLAKSIQKEDYEEAARLRDLLRGLEANDVAGVLEANAAFYHAFRTCDMEAMGRIWGDGPGVQVIHPRSECITGRESVLESWRIILNAGRIDLTIADCRAVATPGVGWVTCSECTGGTRDSDRTQATNIFENQDGVWRIVHHHGG